MAADKGHQSKTISVLERHQQALQDCSTGSVQESPVTCQVVHSSTDLTSAVSAPKCRIRCLGEDSPRDSTTDTCSGPQIIDPNAFFGPVAEIPCLSEDSVDDMESALAKHHDLCLELDTVLQGEPFEATGYFLGGNDVRLNTAAPPRAMGQSVWSSPRSRVSRRSLSTDACRSCGVASNGNAMTGRDQLIPRALGTIQEEISPTSVAVPGSVTDPASRLESQDNNSCPPISPMENSSTEGSCVVLSVAERPQSFGMHSPDKLPKSETEFQSIACSFGLGSPEENVSRPDELLHPSYNPRLFCDGGLYLDPDIIGKRFPYKVNFFTLSSNALASL